MNKKCFSGHRRNRTQDRGLSGHTINCYLRSLRIFFSWLTREDVIPHNPFDRVKVPLAPKKLVATLSNDQIRQLLATIDTSTPEGYRNSTLILTLLDTGLRVSELCTLKLSDTRLDEGMVKVRGKGDKERLVPIGRQIQRLLFHYITHYRHDPALPYLDCLFLSCQGRPLTRGRVGKIVAHAGLRAGLFGVRCSPHTLRHTAAISFLRNGADVFSLQRMLGHSSLEMTRRYCELTDVDLKRAHLTASPVDNLDLRIGRGA